MTGWPVAAFVGLWAAARLAVLFSAYGGHSVEGTPDNAKGEQYEKIVA
jgi:uncharacterized protein involved in response to NO